MEKAEPGLLTKKPRNPKEGILTKRFILQILLQGALIAVCTMTAYHTGLATGSEAAASTMAFSTLTLARLFHGFNCRSSHSIFKIGLMMMDPFFVDVILSSRAPSSLARVGW